MDKTATEAFIQDHNNSETVSYNTFVCVCVDMSWLCAECHKVRPLALDSWILWPVMQAVMLSTLTDTHKTL